MPAKTEKLKIKKPKSKEKNNKKKTKNKENFREFEIETFLQSLRHKSSWQRLQITHTPLCTHRLTPHSPHHHPYSLAVNCKIVKLQTLAIAGKIHLDGAPQTETRSAKHKTLINTCGLIRNNLFKHFLLFRFHLLGQLILTQSRFLIACGKRRPAK